ncbi:hypothetical protein OHC33_002224 [Knufia fluminis]|uniref:L-type lectin-like domain-containing protein n=1 Tax=Knufia fluminis TaxID=191047 RepID=A0AAN8IR45_9EURO|nr:hypothetical protein OHC33_002224 [Knufia fluminis]
MRFLGALLATASLALAQVVEDLSFGHKQPISPNTFSIPGWSILGEGHVPQILSDKVVMTPPAGGNKRGALWSEKKNTLSEWTADFEFRAGGPDRAGGNLQLWYVRDGASKVSTGSLYTTNKFEGLAIVVDTLGGVQKIRGFLNDGNTDYKSHHTVESLAFGHCDYSYRNLGRPSKLQVKYGASGLSVTIDGNQCFSTPKVSLPADYTFGITAASSDPPDSFEVFKFAVSLTGSGGGAQQQYTGSQQPIVNTGSQNEAHVAASASQFDDLHNRIQALSKSVDSLSTDVQKTRQVQSEILELLRSSNLQGAIDSKLNNMDKLVGEIHRDIKSADHKGQYDKLSQQIQLTHEGITEHVPGKLREYVQSHTPRIGFIAFSFMAFQSCCLAVLLWQKWRKSTMPKKFL